MIAANEKAVVATKTKDPCYKKIIDGYHVVLYVRNFSKNKKLFETDLIIKNIKTKEKHRSRRTAPQGSSKTAATKWAKDQIPQILASLKEKGAVVEIKKRKTNESFSISEFPDVLITINCVPHKKNPSEQIVSFRTRNLITKEIIRYKKVLSVGKENIKDWVVNFLINNQAKKDEGAEHTEKDREKNQNRKKTGKKSAKKIKSKKSKKTKQTEQLGKIVDVKNGIIYVEKLIVQTYEISKDHPDYNKLLEEIYNNMKK
jgi:hypothetical protein